LKREKTLLLGRKEKIQKRKIDLQRKKAAFQIKSGRKAKALSTKKERSPAKRKGSREGRDISAPQSLKNERAGVRLPLGREWEKKNGPIQEKGRAHFPD